MNDDKQLYLQEKKAAIEKLDNALSDYLAVILKNVDPEFFKVMGVVELSTMCHQRIQISVKYDELQKDGQVAGYQAEPDIISDMFHFSIVSAEETVNKAVDAGMKKEDIESLIHHMGGPVFAIQLMKTFLSM